jgi:WG repeat protein
MKRLGNLLFFVCLVVLLALVGVTLYRDHAKKHEAKKSLYPLFGYMDTSGKVVIPPTYELAYEFSEGLAPVQKDGKYGYIDRKGAMAIQPAFMNAGTFRDGLAPVLMRGGHGYIDTTGRIVIPP